MVQGQNLRFFHFTYKAIHFSYIVFHFTYMIFHFTYIDSRDLGRKRTASSILPTQSSILPT